MFDLPIPQPAETPSPHHEVKVGRQTHHRAQVLDEGPRRKRKSFNPEKDYLTVAAALIGASTGYFLFTSRVLEALPILLIACVVLLYLR